MANSPKKLKQQALAFTAFRPREVAGRRIPIALRLVSQRDDEVVSRGPRRRSGVWMPISGLIAVGVLVAIGMASVKEYHRSLSALNVLPPHVEPTLTTLNNTEDSGEE